MRPRSPSTQNKLLALRRIVSDICAELEIDKSEAQRPLRDAVAIRVMRMAMDGADDPKEIKRVVLSEMKGNGAS